MLKRMLVLFALSLGTAAAAHADPITGYFSAAGTDSFTSSTFQFGNAAVAGGVGGTLASYFSAGVPIDFMQDPLAYTSGLNIIPGSGVGLFSITNNGVNIAFTLTSFTAGYINNGTNGCSSGSTCLDFTGNGYFTGTGALAGTSNAAVFTFTSQYVAGQTVATLTSFSASSSVTPIVPEPAPLLLVGMGMIGACAFVRRRCMA